MSSAADLRAEARRLNREAKRVEEFEVARDRALREMRKPKEPTTDPTGADMVIVRFVKFMSGTEYHYAAVRFGRGQSRRWAVTNCAQGDQGRYTWTGLMDFVGEANWPSLALVTAVEFLLGPFDEPVVKETIGAYGKVIGTEGVPRGEGGDAGTFRPGGVIGPFSGASGFYPRYPEPNRW
jgi:hypothetical protein